MRCTATVPARWHTPEHRCSFEAVAGGLCIKHLSRPARLRHQIAALEDEERELVAMLEHTIAAVRCKIAQKKNSLKGIEAGAP